MMNRLNDNKRERERGGGAGRQTDGRTDKQTETAEETEIKRE